MHLDTILLAANTANYPYIVALLALVVSIVAIIQVAGLRRDLNQKSAAPAAAPAMAPVAVAAPAPAAARPVPAPADDEIAPEIVAIIAAAVAIATGRSGRIVAIKKVDMAWEKAGRQSVLSSHKIR